MTPVQPCRRFTPETEALNDLRVHRGFPERDAVEVGFPAAKGESLSAPTDDGNWLEKIIKSSGSDLHWRPDLTRRQAGKRVVLRHISIRLLTERWGLVLWRDGGKKKKKLHNNGRQNSSFPVQQQQGSVAERDVPAGLLQNHETPTIRRILFYRQDDFWRVGVPACSPQRPGRGGINFLLSPLGSS